MLMPMMTAAITTATDMLCLSASSVSTWILGMIQSNTLNPNAVSRMPRMPNSST
jgi:hypothetical protein